MNKKARKIKLVFFKIASFMCLFLFNSCGLEVIDYYYPPNPSDNAYIEPSSLSEQKITFFTNASSNTSPFYKGTKVYYRIYNDEQKAKSDRQALTSYVTDSSTSYYAFERLTSTYKYQKLNNSDTLFLKNSPPKEEVILDFTTINTEGSEARATYNENTFDIFRIVQNYKKEYLSFNLGSDYSYNAEVDIDIEYTSDSASSSWYINFFAVNFGISETFTEQYSTITYIGSVLL